MSSTQLEQDAGGGSAEVPAQEEGGELPPLPLLESHKYMDMFTNTAQ